MGEAWGGATKVVPCEKWKGSLGKAEIDTVAPPTPSSRYLPGSPWTLSASLLSFILRDLIQ